MRILIVSQYFWPENFRINDLAKNLKKNKYEVDILTGEPNYPDGEFFKDYLKNKKKYSYFKKIKVYRSPIIKRGNGSKINLLINYLSFNISSIVLAYFKLKNKEYDYILTFGTSPITAAITSIYLKKKIRAKHILWVLDLWPEVVFELNFIKNKILKKILIKIVDFIYQNTDIFLVQSRSFEKYFRSKINKPIYFFPSWPERFRLRQNIFTNKIKKNDEYLKIMFAGNIGQAQNLEEIYEVIETLKEEKIHWIFVGGGRFSKIINRNKNYLKNKSKIQFIEYQKLKDMDKFYNHADVLLLTLKSGKFGSFTIPGKFQTYIKTGKPILCHALGEVSEIVNNNKIGFSSKPGDKKLLCKNVLKFLQMKRNNKFKKYKIYVKKKSKNLEKQYSEKNLFSFLKYQIEHHRFIYPTFNLIKDTKILFKRKNFIYSALNLAFLGSYASGKISINNNLYLWPDGIFGVNFFKSKNIIKKSGRKILQEISLPSFIKEIIVIGNLPALSRLYLEKKFEIKKKKIKINSITLPYGTIDDFKKYLPKNLSNKQLVITTLPTPKQEQVANYLSNNNKSYKIICLGGAINMLAGLEAPVPGFLEKYFESIWRLQYDPFRRLKRLINTTYNYIRGNNSKIFLKLNKKIINT